MFNKYNMIFYCLIHITADYDSWQVCLKIGRKYVQLLTVEVTSVCTLPCVILMHLLCVVCNSQEGVERRSQPNEYRLQTLQGDAKRLLLIKLHTKMEITHVSKNYLLNFAQLITCDKKLNDIIDAECST